MGVGGQEPTTGGASPTPSPQTLTPPVPAAPAAFANGRYQIVKFLGEGGKKRVYLAHDTKLDRDVAFALLKTDGLDPEGLIRVRREAQAMARLGDHPHIVTVYDIGEEPSLRQGSGQAGSGQEGQPYLVSQYMAGGSLDRLLAESDQHRLPADRALDIADQLCEALEHAHAQGVVHRDLKPGNVWLSGVWGWGFGGQQAAQPELAQPGFQPTTGAGPARPTPKPQTLTPQSGSQTLNPSVKLGDFGLALSLDRSRLTQAGMMVGTVAYMAPEQALGGEVTPRSDLYSLGAMLYELVTGRPPFVGDESVAVISQHLNTPPVAPGWHNPEVPPALETLILRLLEKDPEKRPASATEVRQILQGVWGLGVGGQEPTTGASPTPSPQTLTPTAMYRRVFVGREQELRQMETAFDGALSGQGALTAVVGEPGIGKTALCEQLSTYVAVRGGKTLVGHCYEEGSLSLPYLAFVEALRSYVLTREPDGLKQDLGTGATEVARIISEVRDRLKIEPAPPGGDPDEERWRLLQAVAGFLRNAANVQPILLVLEDLHWADRGTLDLLLHLARNLQGARLLVVATYRDLEVDRAHPLSAALAELRRISSFDRVPLRGLTPDEVHRMINAIQGQEIRWSFAEAVHRQTEGNPLFVQEVLRYLVEEGLIVRKEGRWRETGEAPPELSIPEGLRDVIGKRLSRLSPSCNQVLSIAAVIGREFRLDVLQRVAGVPEEELYSALEEATALGVIEQHAAIGAGATFRFAHAFFRQTLYEEIFVPRRIRLHQQIGRALEELYAPGRGPRGQPGVRLAPSAARPAGRLPEHAAELADHFAQSTEADDLTKALAYSELAAQRAMQVYAYGEAVRHLDRALLVQDVLDPDDRAKRCDLLLALGEAQMPLGEPRKVADSIGPEAFALAEDLDDRARAAAACRLVLEGLARDLTNQAPRDPQYRPWAERLDQRAAPGSADGAYADIALGRLAIAAGDREAGIDRLRRALELARRLDDPELLFTCAWRVIQAQVNSPHWPEAAQIAEEFTARPRDRLSGRTIGQIDEFAGVALLASGDRAGAERAWRELSEVAGRTRDAFTQVNALSFEAALATLDGRLEEAVDLAHQIVAKREEVGLAGGFVARCQSAFVYLGRSAEFRTLRVVPRPDSAEAARAAADVGELEETRRIIGEWLTRVRAQPQIAPSEDLPLWLEAAVAASAEEALPLLADRAAEWPPVIALGGPTLRLRLRAEAAMLLGDREAARARYQEALELATKIRFRPEVALARLGLAELLLDEATSYQGSAVSDQESATSDQPSAIRRRQERLKADELKAEGSQHLDFAIGEFRAMKMQPALERAMSCRASLEAQ